ncbi:hypothetical protein [Thomasclavelia cocleata]|uniref:hypothetical protein n=1 Tax=Thomasclavelia cocleata TaxID=69824 RepID=UPI00255A7CF2|nr:hypothetical protein [Thomasclavelia cocleata]
MKLKDFFNLCVNDYIIYIYVSENQLVYKDLLDKFDKEDLYDLEVCHISPWQGALIIDIE